MSSWAAFESSISSSSSASSSHPFSLSSAHPPLASPRNSPRNNKSGFSFTSPPSIPPSQHWVPSIGGPWQPIDTQPPAPSTPAFSRTASYSAASPFTPVLNRANSTTSSTAATAAPSSFAATPQPAYAASYQPQPQPPQQQPSQPGLAPSSVFSPFAVGNAPPAAVSNASAPAAAAPSTPASSRQSSSRPFSSYTTFPSLSGNKRDAFPTGAQTADSSLFSGGRSRAAGAGGGGGGEKRRAAYTRSLVSPALTQRYQPFSLSSVTPSSPAAFVASESVWQAMQSLLQSSLVYAQYLQWKQLDRQQQLVEYVRLFLPLQLALLLLFSLSLSSSPLSSLPAFSSLLLFLFSLLQAGLAMARIRLLIRTPTRRWFPLLRFSIPVVTAEEVLATAFIAVGTVLSALLLYYALCLPPLRDDGYVHDLLLSSAVLCALWDAVRSLLRRRLLSVPTVLLPPHLAVYKLLPPAVFSSVLAAAKHCLLCTAAFVLLRSALLPLLCWLSSSVLPLRWRPDSWWTLLSAVPALYRLLFLLYLSSSLSASLLAYILTRPLPFPLPHLLLALYDAADALYRRLALSGLASLLCSSSPSSLLSSPLSALFPDLKTQATAVDAVVIAVLTPLTSFTARMRRRLEEDKRRRREAQHLLVPTAAVRGGAGAGTVLRAEEDWYRVEDEESLLRCAEAASCLLQRLEQDGRGMLQPYMQCLLIALLDLKEALDDWTQLEQAARAAAAGGSSLQSIAAKVQQLCERAVESMRAQLKELELPARYRDRLESLQS